MDGTEQDQGRTPRVNAFCVTMDVHLQTEERGRKRVCLGIESTGARKDPALVPRLARLMALALHFEDLLGRGEVRSMAALARLGHVSRARVTQIMNLLNLAPDIQERMLLLQYDQQDQDPMTERRLRLMLREAEWERQRQLWPSSVLPFKSNPKLGTSMISTTTTF